MTSVTSSLTLRRRLLFDTAALTAIIVAVVLLTGCPPNEVPDNQDPEGEFTVSTGRILGMNSDFSIRDELVYPVHDREGISITSLQISDKKLTEVRCTWCHECGFEEAWDWKNYGSSKWSPTYVGEEWGPIVVRMKDKEMSFLQEEMIAKRIYEYLRDDSLGVYDEDEDDKGAVRIEVDELPTPVNPAQVVTPEDEGGEAGEGEAPESGEDKSEPAPVESPSQEA